MANVTFQQALNAVKHYDSYYKKNRSQNHLSAFAHSIQESVEDFSVSEPNFYHMYLVCETIIPHQSKRSTDSIIKYCKDELCRDIHYWQYNTLTNKK